MCIYLNLMILIKIIRGFIRTWLMFSPGMVCIFVCRPGGSVFPVKTWPAGKWTVSAQKLS